MAESVIVQATLNGSRVRAEHPGVPFAPREVADEARRCAEAGAGVVHVHARDRAGAASTDPAWYTETLRLIHVQPSAPLVSITSLRLEGKPVADLLAMLETIAVDPATLPDLMSVNPGHVAVWEPRPDGPGERITRHFPNGYEDVAPVLRLCARTGIVPELGLMDIGFISNAVLLLEDGLISPRPWCLLELDSPRFGAGGQVAPSTIANYDHLAAVLAEHLPGAAWAAHGNGLATYTVILRALERGHHVRVGYEDAVVAPSGALAHSNAELVEWTVARARERGLEPATPDQARAVLAGRGLRDEITNVPGRRQEI